MQEMEDCWLSGVALRGETSSHPALRWLKTVVVSGWGKGARDASGRDQEDVPESVPRPRGRGAGRDVVSVEIKTDDIETGDSNDLRDEPGGGPLTGQAVSGVKTA